MEKLLIKYFMHPVEKLSITSCIQWNKNFTHFLFLVLFQIFLHRTNIRVLIYFPEVYISNGLTLPSKS